MSDRVSSDLQHGVVVKFDAERGYGFIRPSQAGRDTNQDVFVHVRNVAGRRTLHAGQQVRFYLARTDRGLAAIKVQPGSVLGIPYLRFTLVGIGSALLLLFGLATALDRPASVAVWLLLWVISLGIATFGVYGWDKAQAVAGGNRVPEAVLLLLVGLGGGPGAFIAMQLFRHKTRKPRFLAIFWLIVAAQAGVLIWWWLTHQGI